MFERCLKSVWTSQHACTAVQTVCKHFSWQHKLFGVLLKHCSNFSACTCCCLNIACCSVQTCYTFFSMCLNSVQTMFEQFVLVWQCSNTVFGHVIHSFPCVQMVFKQPTVQWCAVQTLFKQFGLVWQSLNTSNSVRTACSCPPPAVSSFHFFFLSPFPICLFTVIHVCLQAHALFFIFYFLFIFSFFYRHPCPHPSATR